MERPIRQVLDEEIARQIGLKCVDCSSKHVIYAITFSIPPAFPEGAYCYRCLLMRCGKSQMIPLPMPEDILNKLKFDLKLDRVKKWYFIKEGNQT